jgi:dipeptidyl aminopeptidase/acylaminoacyl peptidase
MQLTFSSRGKEIPIDVIVPSGNSPRPAVLVLHGSGGISDYPEEVCELAARGYVVLIPHYFDSTGTSWADLESIRRHGLMWGKTVLDAVSFAKEFPEIDPESVGILGFSLGGYLAIAVAAHVSEIKCVVELFGGVPEKFLPEIVHLPPTLIIHGEDDRVVPARHAIELKQLCQQKQVYFEMEIYPGAGHNFSGLLMKKAIERAATFLDKRLKNSCSMNVAETASQLTVCRSQQQAD